ncbi:MAG TPA: DHA2 family efflux MFS transporter permease subunit, partial [Acidimicrobiales bacterium]|nr:DHA2 family efflux MFS transporter permease subunit [Acidimicrobiales bacterium]
AVAAVCIGAFMGQLDASIVTQAFPTLERSFGVGVGPVTWVGLSYLLVLVATVAAVGRFADMFGRKLLYIYGFLIFIAGSALCALAPNLSVLCGFRVLQAVGAAMLQANSVAIIALAVPVQRLGRSIGIQGAAQALGLAFGPSVGGLLLAVGGWRWLFLVNVPVGMIGVAAGLLFIPRSRHLQARVGFDWSGFALFFPAVVALVSVISLGTAQGWTSPPMLGLMGAAAVLGVGFVARERRSARPMVDLSLFRRVRFTAGIVSGMLSFLVMFGILVIVPFLLERGYGYGTARSGIELMAMPLALGIVAPLAGRLADRVGVGPPGVGGLGVAALGLVGLSVLHPDPVALVALLVLTGVGLGLFVSPNNAGIMAAIPAQQSGLASGVLNMARGIGTALGLAVSGAVFGAVAGSLADAAQVRHAFAVTALVLAGAAALGAAVALYGVVADPAPARHRQAGTGVAVSESAHR